MVSITTFQLCHRSANEARGNTLVFGMTTIQLQNGSNYKMDPITKCGAVAYPGMEELGTGETSSLQTLY